MSGPRHQQGIRNVINQTSWSGILLECQDLLESFVPDPEYAEVFLTRNSKFPKSGSIIDQEEFNQWHSRIPTDDRYHS
jgi:hypothetical protein